MIVDTSGLALAHLAGVGGTGIDTLIMDEFEAGRLFAVGNIDAVEASGRAGLLVRRGVARTVVITLGGHGAVAATVEGAWQVTPPEVRVESAVGAGDSFVAAFAIASAEGRTLAGTMRYAMGAATSAVTTPGTELCTREGTETYSRLATCAPLVPPDRC